MGVMRSKSTLGLKVIFKPPPNPPPSTPTSTSNHPIGVRWNTVR